MNHSEYPTKQASPSLFSTERLQLAIYLHASRQLGFLRCEPLRSGKVRFVFADPGHEGAELELNFDRGAEVPATELFASQKFLRRKMTEVQESRKHRAYEYSHQ